MYTRVQTNMERLNLGNLQEFMPVTKVHLVPNSQKETNPPSLGPRWPDILPKINAQENILENFNLLEIRICEKWTFRSKQIYKLFWGFKCLFRVSDQVHPSETKTTTKCTKFETCKLYFKHFMVYNYLYTYCLRNWTNSSSHYCVVYVFWKNFLSNPPLLSSRTPTCVMRLRQNCQGAFSKIKAVKIAKICYLPALFTKPPDGLPTYRTGSGGRSVRRFPIDIFLFCREWPVTKEPAALWIGLYSAIHKAASSLVTGRSLQNGKMSMGSCHAECSPEAVLYSGRQSSSFVNSTVSYWPFPAEWKNVYGELPYRTSCRPHSVWWQAVW